MSVKLCQPSLIRARLWASIPATNSVATRAILTTQFAEREWLNTCTRPPLGIPFHRQIRTQRAVA
jgi:hypothetical protein